MYDRTALERVQPPAPKNAATGKAVWSKAPVYGRGGVVLVGEAPGRVEDEEGEPFVGRAGVLLREAVNDVGLKGYAHYTNASLYRPRPNAGKDIRPLASQVTLERTRLKLEIVQTEPRAVLALGHTAQEALCPGHYLIRGRVIMREFFGHKVPVYLTWHPAYVFRNPDAYEDIMWDLERVSSGRIPFTPRGHYVIPDNPFSFVGDYITVDVETQGLPVHLAPFVCAVWQDIYNSYVMTKDNAYLFIEAYSRFEGRTGQHTIGHNTLGDAAAIRRLGFPNFHFTDDTLLLHYAHHPGRTRRSLKSIAPAYGNVETLIDTMPRGHREDEETDDDGGFISEDMEKTYRYCTVDTVATRTVFESMDSRLPLYQFLMQAQQIFAQGMQRGIRVDMDYYKQIVAKAEKMTRQLLDSFTFNPDSPDQVLEALHTGGYKVKDTRGETLKPLTKDLPKNFYEVEDWTNKDLPTRLLGYKKWSKLWSAFIQPLPQWVEHMMLLDQEYDILHPIHKLHGTVNGRTSSADPNVQQIPKELKRLFIAREGFKLVGWDMKAHEVRGIAYLSRDEALIQMLNEGLDPHKEIGKAAGISRDQGKHVLFARAYGASIKKLLQIGLTLEQAQKSIEVVDSMFPKLNPWREQVVADMWEKGVLITPFDRRREFPYADERLRHHLENAAVNFLPQSLCNDITLNSMILVWKQFGYPTLLFVHDFVCIEVPEGGLIREVDRVVNFIKHLDPWPNPVVKFVPEVYTGNHWGALTNKEGFDILQEEEEDDE